MKFKVLDKTISIPNAISDINKTLEKASEIIETNRFELLGLNIDGEMFYDDASRYIEKNLNTIEIIEVKLKAHKSLLDEDLVFSLDKVDFLIENLIDNLYKSENGELCIYYKEIIELLEECLKIFEFIRQKRYHVKKYDYLESIHIKLNETVRLIVEKLEYGDRMYVLDLIIYEMIPILNQIRNFISEIFKNENEGVENV